MDGAAQVVGRLLEGYLGPGAPVGLHCWDGTRWGDPGAPLQVHVRSPDALRRLLWDPDELGLARAHVAGDLDFDGSVFDLLGLRDRLVERDPEAGLGLRARERLRLAADARRLGVLGRRPAPPPEEARLGGRRHSRRRDRDAISHHYDVGNDFYRLVLGPSMTYSCALFPERTTSLEEAQALKYEHICRKLGLRSGDRLLDIGCGWGGMVLHAARHHGVRAVGITISEQQAIRAQERIVSSGLEGRVEVRLQDYRDVDDGPYDAVSSIGMFEHVGMEQAESYFRRVRSLLRPGGRLLNHAISRTSGQGPLPLDSFPARYVFPDGELHEVGRTVSTMQDLGFECRDVESLREHYARTLRCWVGNLEADWERAVAFVGEPRARIWRLYMAGSAVGFDAHRLNLHQVLVVNTGADGRSGMPPSRPATLTRMAGVAAGSSEAQPRQLR